MTSKETPDCFLSFAEVAEIISVSEDSLRHAECETHELLRIKLGRRIVFSYNDVQAWITRHKRKTEDDRTRRELNNPAFGKSRLLNRKGINKSLRFRLIK